MHYYLYKITNIKNNKYYFGSHKTDNLDDGYMGSGILIKRAINKYGLLSFKKDILSFYNSDEELRQAEDTFLKNLTTKTGLYNLKFCSMGGDTRAKYTFIKKKKYVQKLIDNPRCPIGKCGQKNIMFGKKHTDEYKSFMSLQTKQLMDKIKITNPLQYKKQCKPRKVRAVLNTGQILTFECIKECAEHFNINKRYLAARLRITHKTRILLKKRPISILPNINFEYIA